MQKCVTFFLYAAIDAGVTISGRVMKGRKPRPLTPRRKRPAAPSPLRDPEAAPPLAETDAPRIADRKPSEFLLMHLEPKDMDDEQQAAVWTLLKYFKARGL